MTTTTALTPRNHGARLDLIQEESYARAKLSLTASLGEAFFHNLNFSLLVTGSTARKESLGSGRSIELIFVKTKDTVLSPFSFRRPSVESPYSTFSVPLSSSPSSDRTTETPDGFLNQSFASSEERGRETPCEGFDPIFDPLVKQVKDVISLFPLLFYPKLEICVLGSDQNPLKHESPGGGVYIPNRALDASYLLGNPNIAHEYRSLAFSCLKEMNSKNRISFEKHFHSPSVLELENCMNGTQKKPIDMNAGILFFDNNRIMSTKYVLLRAVQYHLMHLLMSECRQKETAVMDGMPFRIVDRLYWMHSLGMLPSMKPEELEELCKAYDLGMQWYEQSQMAYEKEGKQEIRVDAEELARVTRIIRSFVEIAPSSPIQNLQKKKSK